MYTISMRICQAKILQLLIVKIWTTKYCNYHMQYLRNIAIFIA